jgi:hypothetical protein
MTSERGPRRKLTGIGVELRDSRLGRGYSIDDCQRATRISRRYLEALEDEDFSALPAPVFARGFLRSYAQHLGMDPTAMLARFPSNPRAPAGSQERGAYPRDISPTRLRSAAPYYDDEFAEDQALPPIPSLETEPSSFRLGPWLVAAFVVLVVFAGVVVVVTLGDDELEGTDTDVTTLPPGVPAAPSDVEGEDESFTAPLTVPEGTVLPSFSEVSVADAQLWLRRSGAPFVIVEVFDPAQVGLVVDQQPASGTTLDSGTAVTVVVSRGPAPAPGTPGGGVAGDGESAQGADEAAPAAARGDDIAPIERQ